MAKLTLGLGVSLIAIGLIGYGLASFSEYASWTALIPAIVGLPFLILGALALAKPGWRKHLMHAAVALAVIFIPGVSMRLPTTFGADEINVLAATIQVLSLLLLLGYVAAGVKSFIDARKARTASLA
ncbi:MAG: hypothetical protein ACFCVE_09370 [Phycisphaerae bacterium]